MYPKLKKIQYLDFYFGLELILRIILNIMTPIAYVVVLIRVLPDSFTTLIDTIINIKTIGNRPGIDFLNLVFWFIILLVALTFITRGLWLLLLLLFKQIRVVTFVDGSYDIVSLKEATRIYNITMISHIEMALNDIIDMLDDKEDNDEEQEVAH